MKQEEENKKETEKVNDSLDLALLDNEKNEKQIALEKDKWYIKFKGIFYSLLSGTCMAISSILVKKCVFFNGFEQAAVIYYLFGL